MVLTVTCGSGSDVVTSTWTLDDAFNVAIVESLCGAAAYPGAVMDANGVPTLEALRASFNFAIAQLIMPCVKNFAMQQASLQAASQFVAPTITIT